ncbi:MAG: hypothetical protein MUW55_08485 [Pantoea vagans]|nr:hypothetical protein [Pantoea vagans]
MDNKADTQLYVLKIRRLAASCQQGESLVSVKAQVQAVIKSYQQLLGKNPKDQAKGWSDLFDGLGAFLNNNSAPEWMDVIRYARKVINFKKHTAIFCVKRMYGADPEPATRKNG